VIDEPVTHNLYVTPRRCHSAAMAGY
jgi:hypothetical protein